MAIPQRRPNRGMSGSMSRKDFIRTVGVGAAAVGATTMGFSGVGRAQEAAPLSTTIVPTCRIDVGGFNNIIPDGLTPVGLTPVPPFPAAYPVFVKHPNYDDVVKENCVVFDSCGSPQIPIGHGVTWGPYGWGMNETTDYTVGLNPAAPTDMKLLTFFGSPFTPSPPGAFPALDNGVLFNRWYLTPPSTPNPLPPNAGTGGLTWGQAFAFNGAASGFNVQEYPYHPQLNTYNPSKRYGPSGNFVGPLTDVTQVPKPTDLDPAYTKLDLVTTRVEFTVTIPWTVNVVTTPTGPFPVMMPYPYTFKIFGWYMHNKKGKGLGRPLVVHMNGIYNYMSNASPGGKGQIKYLSALALSGIDVLYFDKPGHGWSQGKLATFYPSTYFQIIDQLGSGVRAIGPGETAVTTKKLRSDDPRIVMSGHSLGALLNRIVVTANMHPEWYNIPAFPPKTHPVTGDVLFPGYAGFTMPFSANAYNILGIIDIEGLPGGLKYTSPGLLRAMSGFLAWGMDSTNNPMGKYILPKQITGSSEQVGLLSDPAFPPLLTVTTHQNYMSPAGAVYAYNTHTGLKRIQMFLGTHGSALNADLTSVDDLIPVVKEFYDACTKLEEPVTDTTQVDLETLVCDALAGSMLAADPYNAENDDDAKIFKKSIKEAVKDLKHED